MNVYGVQIPDKALTNFELLKFVKELNIPHFSGVFMRDALPEAPHDAECGIVNFNKLFEPGSHWVAYYKNGQDRKYFDSFGQVTLDEVQKYLKNEDEKDKQVIQRNTDIVQIPGTSICGHLCLYVLKSLNNGITFRNVLNSLTFQGTGIKWSNPLADELHKPVCKKFPKRHVFARNVNDIWGADLVDMHKLAKDNDNFKFILMVVDVFSKFGWSVPLKSKSGDAVKTALETIFSKQTPKKIWSDAGTEFYNIKVKHLLRSYDIELYSTKNEEKCSVVERWNRTIKTQLWKYFTANGTHRYIDVLQPLIDRYNSTKHRSTGFTPSDAQKQANYEQVFENLYFKNLKQQTSKNPKFKVGDKVRLAIQKDKFEKAYIINWSDRVYKIKEVKKTIPFTYTVEDERGRQHRGTFYEQELQINKDERFRIEKILKYKTVKGKRYGLVKWIGYDDSFNSWEPAEELKLM